MLLMDEATSAMDTHTQKRAAEGIAAEQRRLGFSIVQVAHRIETLRRSDILYFVEHGQVVETGGLQSMNGTAIEELSALPIEYKTVVNPETGKEERHLAKGFYRQLHEAYYDLDFGSMNLGALVKKVRTLEEQLARAEQEKASKMAPLLNKLAPPPPPLSLERAVTGREKLAPPLLLCERAVSEGNKVCFQDQLFNACSAESVQRSFGKDGLLNTAPLREIDTNAWSAPCADNLEKATGA